MGIQGRAYIAHHEPFEYYASTANPHHLAPASLASIGTDTQHYVGGVPQFDTANHNYDTSDFDSLVAAIGSRTLPPSALPAVSFLKVPGYQDGHAGYSDPADEQAFIVREIDALEKTPDWSSTAVFINYDDSDGWYDHAYPGVQNPSTSPADALTGPGQCLSSTVTQPLANEQGRCGLGPRLPMIVVSPWARANHVDHDLSDQASIINFVEYNWRLPGIAGLVRPGARFDGQVEGDPVRLRRHVRLQARVRHADLPARPEHGPLRPHGRERAREDLERVNLAGAEMSNASLQGVNLEGAFLEYANLSGANLRGTRSRGRRPCERQPGRRQAAGRHSTA